MSDAAPDDRAVKLARIREIVRTITEPLPEGQDWGRRIAAEMTMRIPAEPNRDADLVLSWAADEIDRLRAENEALKNQINASAIFHEGHEAQMETLRGLLAEARTVTADALHDSLSGGRRTYSSVLSDLLSRIDAALGEQG